MNPLDRKK